VRQATRTSPTVVWALLVALTALSWLFGRGDGLSPAGQQAASVLVLVVALLKARLVGVHFMALRNAPAALMAVFHIWCLAVCITTVALYLMP
jgi:heme/copper-type cytochrome/quinol oxidase subunit 4